jgi:NodT family efflux transporter outer membrane factor (OMF) lipoprotein
MKFRTIGLGRPLATVALLSLTLGACAQTAPYVASRDFAVPTRWAAFAASEPRLRDSGWVASFNSPVLSQLVQEALANNRDLRAAAARLDEARALSRQSGAAVYPTLTADISARSEGNGSSRSSVDASLRSAWEVDLWGRVRGEKLAAGYDAVAAEAIFDSARQSLAGAVAVAWIDVNGNARALDIARQELSARNALLNNVEQRVAAQTLLVVEANSARAEVARARDRVVAAEGELANALRVLEVLTGRYPSGSIKAVSGLPALPRKVPVGLPSQILERRPDLIAAERQVAAAFYRRTEAQAARLPRLSLSGNITARGGSLGDALDPGRIVWELVGNVIAPLIDGGRQAEVVNIRTAKQAEALALYGAKALTAFREVESAIADEDVLRRRLALLNSAASQLEGVVVAERERFEAGEVELSRLDDVRLRYYAALREANTVRVALLRNRVALHLALGGSFATRAPAPVVVAVAEQEVAGVRARP